MGIGLHYVSDSIFKCHWVENNNDIKMDDLGFTLVDLNIVGHKTNSFILASQATQVFYIKDPLNDKWSLVLLTKQRCFIDHYGEDESNDQVVDYSVLKNYN